MGYLLRMLAFRARYLVWGVAITASGAAYAFLSARETVTILSGEPHVLDWWEPYVWPAVVFIVIQKVGRMIIRRTVGEVQAGINRLKG